MSQHSPTTPRRRVRRALVLVLIALLGYGIGVAQPYVFRGPLMLGQDAVWDEAGMTASVSVNDVGGKVVSIRPADGADVLFVLYPGGLVRPQAYEWLGRALAAHGVHTVIPEFPFDLAVLDSGRATELIEHYGADQRVVVGGHSLGGAMAASHAADHPVDGLLLLAAYPSASTVLQDPSLKAVSLLAEHDDIAAAEDVRGGLDRLPAGTELIVVEGAVHSFFGRYGPQQGDGVPTVSREAAEAAIVVAATEFFEVVRG